jgi:hypothetical protein
VSRQNDDQTPPVSQLAVIHGAASFAASVIFARHGGYISDQELTRHMRTAPKPPAEAFDAPWPRAGVREFLRATARWALEHLGED